MRTLFAFKTGNTTCSGYKDVSSALKDFFESGWSTKDSLEIMCYAETESENIDDENIYKVIISKSKMNKLFQEIDKMIVKEVKKISKEYSK